MKYVLKLFILVAVFLFASCGGSEPKDLAEEAAECVQKKDFNGLVALMVDEDDPESSKDQSQFVALMQEKMGKQIDKKDGIKSYKIGKQVIDEEAGKASVKVEYTYGNGEQDTKTYKFKKKEGKWYLVM